MDGGLREHANRITGPLEARAIDPAYEDGTNNAGKVKPLLAGAFVVTGLIYLGWRTTTFNPDAPAISAIFFATEVLGFLASLVVFFVSMRRLKRTPTPATAGLSVDVFVTTLNEDLRVVRRTIVAATRIRYPHVTWLLDDGDRPAFRALAAELGCRYLARRNGGGRQGWQHQQCSATRDG